ncbi:MAG: hypothetical protein R3B91_07475 [Planctomycetaceae bacterium]
MGADVAEAAFVGVEVELEERVTRLFACNQGGDGRLFLRIEGEDRLVEAVVDLKFTVDCDEGVQPLVVVRVVGSDAGQAVLLAQSSSQRRR